MAKTEARKDAEGSESPTDDWMSLRAAAGELDETRQTVLTRVVKGEIKALHIAGRTIVSRADVAKVRAAKAAA